MGRYLVVENNVVTNIVNFDPQTPEKNGWIVAPSDDVAIGWKRNAQGVFKAPKPEKAPVPEQVETLAFRRALRAEGIMPSFQTAVGAAADEEKEFWQYATTIARDDPSLAKLAEAAKVSVEVLDDIFRRAK